MNKSIPKVTISGVALSGKTTVGMVLTKALREAGINVQMVNEDTAPEPLIDQQAVRLKHLANYLDGEPVVIEYVNTRRGVESAKYLALEPHQQRVVDERYELGERIRKLMAFTKSDAFGFLNPAEKDRMFHQLTIMEELSKVLDERIAAFK